MRKILCTKPGRMSAQQLNCKLKNPVLPSTVSPSWPIIPRFERAYVRHRDTIDGVLIVTRIAKAARLFCLLVILPAFGQEAPAESASALAAEEEANDDEGGNFLDVDIDPINNGNIALDILRNDVEQKRLLAARARNFFRLGFSSIPVDRIEPGIETLAEIVHDLV